MTLYKFGELGKFNEKTFERLKQTAKQATENVANEANTPGTSVAKPQANAGGRLPVDTGNLRGSIRGAIDRMPSGKSTGNTVQEGENSISAAVARWKPETGESIYIGWTANYARRMEYRYGFLRGAVENWDKQVEFAAKQAVLKNP